MTTPKPRSAFLPVMLIIVGMVVFTGLVLVFVPLVQRQTCVGMGLENWESSLDSLELEEVNSWKQANEWIAPEVLQGCTFCNKSGKVPCFRKWRDMPYVDAGIFWRWVKAVRALHPRGGSE